jgi:hypothetical protein
VKEEGKFNSNHPKTSRNLAKDIRFVVMLDRIHLVTKQVLLRVLARIPRDPEREDQHRDELDDEEDYAQRIGGRS